MNVEVNWPMVKILLENITWKTNVPQELKDQVEPITKILWNYASQMEQNKNMPPTGHPSAFIAVGDAAQQALTLNAITTIPELIHEMSIYLKKKNISPLPQTSNEFMQFLQELERLQMSRPDVAGPLYERLSNMWKSFVMSYDDFTRSAKVIAQQQVKINELTNQQKNLTSNLKRCNDQNQRLNKQTEDLVAALNQIQNQSTL